VRQQVETELVGIWAQPTKEGAVTQLAAFKAKYGKLYPEAVRSLAEEEDKTLTFYDFPQTLHRYIKTTNAIESLFSNVCTVFCHQHRRFPSHRVLPALHWKQNGLCIE
jgi:transposase-like protein